MVPFTEHSTKEEWTAGWDTKIEGPVLDDYWRNLAKTAAKFEEIRAICGDKPITINSGLRGKIRNSQIPGASLTSAHLWGLAGDLLPPAGMTLQEMFNRVVQHPTCMLSIDQLIIERGCLHYGLVVPAQRLIPRRDLRTEKDIAGIRTYPLLRIWTPPRGA